MALAEAGRSLESLPKDLKAAIEDGRIPGSIVLKYFELEKTPLFAWLLKFGGFKERLLADDLFLAKVFMECGVGMFTKVWFNTIFDLSLSLSRFFCGNVSMGYTLCSVCCTFWNGDKNFAHNLLKVWYLVHCVWELALARRQLMGFCVLFFFVILILF